MSPSLVRPLAVAAYLLALTGSASFGLFVLGLGTGLWPFGPLVTVDPGWPLDLAWLAVFGLQHSGMAREGFKSALTHVVPPALERSCYVACSGLLLLALPAVWQPLSGEPLWRLPVLWAAVPLLAAAGLVYLNARFDHAGLFGLRQAWAGTNRDEGELVVTGPYRLVRHPLMLCLLLFLWTQPVMTPGLLLLNAGLSAYVVVGIFFEERDLMRRFQSSYASYRRRVPMLLPWRGWRKEGPA